MEECSETVEEVKTTSENMDKNKCSSCTVYIVLFSILFTINVGIATYFVYYKYMNCKEENVSKYGYAYQTVINLNGRRSQTNKYQKLDLLFLHRHDQSQRYPIRVVKNR